ncbi:SDR family NAD(P)-dependent oxidoreductase [Maribellus comscasis]|uniref:SDR family NAD(P)-dependent oxidoreductase n=1 Tax=Maribellus comscasis TaxID=2681766 RepID=A0A6I6JKU7_9BACT|nr:SDR family NAD(P)-dependent oxidoreductase [Maribellus comscasis]QGY42951.1 SDR family NAD(P)-dependent oxidoreductase [Maribellus comscasis]
MNVLITGISSGLGFGLAKHYLENGDTVLGIGRNSNPELDSFSNFQFLKQDISDFVNLSQQVSVFLKNVHHLDLVILNAGILSEIKDVKETSIDEIQKVMNVNVWANKMLIDILTDEIGKIQQIIAISSGASVSGARGWNAYSLSKATLNMLISLYAKEFPEIHFCALAPGLIDSKMQDYIYDLPENENYPVVQRLKKAKGTEQMPGPEKAAENISKNIERLKDYESGSFIDIRTI